MGILKMLPSKSLLLSLLILLTRTDGDQLVADTVCPPGWLDAGYAGLGCLWFSHGSPVTWEEANRYCQEQSSQGALLEIKTEEQIIFLKLYLQANEDSYKYWWVGATDTGREGCWFWISSLDPVDRLVWSASAPTNNLGQNCLTLDPTTLYEGVDLPCAAKSFPLCQIL